MSVIQAVESGDELQILYATRRAVAVELESCDSGRDIAALSNRMIELCERITELEKSRKPKRKSALSAARAVGK